MKYKKRKMSMNQIIKMKNIVQIFRKHQKMVVIHHQNLMRKKKKKKKRIQKK
jgi:hypothetical protein